MKQRKLASLLAVTLSLELMVSPIIPYASADDAAQTINNNAEAINSGIKALGSIWSTVNGMNNQSQINPQLTADLAKLREQQTPQPDKYFNPQKLMQLPGLGEYLAMNGINPGMLDCKTLPTTLHEAKPEVCRIGITNDKNMNQQAQLGQMFQYYNSYFQVSKMYRNFSADSNSDGQAFGVGCMNNAMTILNGFFKYRLDELDKLTTNMEAMQAQFKEASKSDLDAIEEATAVLDGDSDLADKVRSKKPDLFDFGKRFNNPACNSMFAGEALNERGRAGGLNAISKNIKEELTTKKGKYSGESYSQAHAAVVEDIASVADKVAKQFELNFTPNMVPGDYSKFLQGVGGLVDSTSGVQDALRPSLFADVQTRFMEKSAKLTEDRQTVLSELSTVAGVQEAMSFMSTKNNASFEAQLVSMENSIKNNCLKESLGATDSLLSKIYDPTASGHANKNASNYLKDKLRQILANDKSSIEGKLNELKTLESQQGNRYYMRMENSYEVQELDNNGNLSRRVVDASSNRTPSVFFSDIIRNCNAQYKANKIGNKLTASQAIQKLRELNTSYKELAKTQSADIKKELRKKLIECSSPEIANNTVPGSCTSDLFNTRGEGFCANAALSCSKNMQSCSKQAEGFVKEIKDQRTARVNNYKALVQKNKMDVIKMFDSALARYMKDGEMMRGAFGVGFSSPVGIERDVPEQSKYISEIANATGKQGSPDGKLLLEDPVAHTKMFIANIGKLKESVKKQQDQLLGGDSLSAGGKNPGILAEHIRKTEKNYKDVVKEADKIAEECRSNHDNAVKAAEAGRAKQAEEMAKTNSELGEQLPLFCRRFETARTNPGPACNGGMSDLVTSAMRAAARSGNQNDSRAVAEFDEVCSTSGGGSSSSEASVSLPANAQMCEALGTEQKDGKKVYKYEFCNKLITEKFNCNPTTTPGTNGNPAVTNDPCKYDLDQLAKTYQALPAASQRAGQTGTRTVTSSAPSFCTAGSNGNRDAGKNVAGFLDTLAQELGAGRQ